MIDCPVFETQRLILKPRTLEHSTVLQQYFNNWNIIKHLNDLIPWPYPDDGAADHYINQVKPAIRAGECLMWVICEKDSPRACVHDASDKPDHPIGLIEYRLKSHPREDRGFWLAEPFWGKGYMTEAVKCLNDYIFFEVGVPKLRFSNYKTNIASRRVKEKTGACLIGAKTELWRGEEREMEIWELTAEAWKEFN